MKLLAVVAFAFGTFVFHAPSEANGDVTGVTDTDRSEIKSWIISDEFSRQAGIAMGIDGLGPVRMDHPEIVVEGVSSTGAYAWKVDFNVLPMAEGAFSGSSGSALVAKRVDGQKDFYIRKASLLR